MTWKSSAPLTFVVLLSACAPRTLSPVEQPANLIASNGLITQLILDRTEIGPGEQFTAIYSIRNARSEPVRLESACTALAKGVVYGEDEEEHAHFIGSGSGCWTAISSYEIPHGETIEWTWDVTAAIIVRAYPDGREPDIVQAEPGEYAFRVEPNVYLVNDVRDSLPQLQQGLVVR